MQNKPIGTSRFLTLDGLRGIAAVLVAVNHGYALAYTDYLRSVAVAVDLFFMISGFVIPLAYERKLLSGMSIGRFMKVRLIRLYPLYIAGVMISVASALLTIRRGFGSLDELMRQLGWALFLLPRPHWEPGHSFVLNPPAWSLFFELVINVAYVLVLPILSLRVLIVVAALSAGALLGGIWHFQSIDFGVGGPEMIVALARVCCPFTLGVIIYRLWRADRLTALKSPVLVLIALFLLLAVRPNGDFGWIIDYLAVVLVFPLLVACSTMSHPTGWVAKVFHGLGELSYPLYALHMPILNLIVGKRHSLALSREDAVWFGLLVSVILAVVGIYADRMVRGFLTGDRRKLKQEVERAAPL